MCMNKNFNEEIEKTLVTYLPPIPPKVAAFETIYQYLKYLRELFFVANMKYVNVTLDIGAAINCYKLIWNYEKQFSNVIVHPGDFHFMKENFLTMETLTSGLDSIRSLYIRQYQISSLRISL